MGSREQKSSVDILEHVTDGGVHIDTNRRGADVRGSSRESVLGGVVNTESGSQTHRRQSPSEDLPPVPDRSSRER